MSFSDFIDERMLVSKNVLGDKEMKIKVIEVSDETTPMQWKFGDRVKVNKVIITIKHLKSQKIEEGELDIEEVEKKLIKDRIESLYKNKAKKQNQNEAYIALKNIFNDMNEQDCSDLLNSDDPYTFLKQIYTNHDDQLQCISALTPHAIQSMIKEIRSA